MKDIKKSRLSFTKKEVESFDKSHNLKNKKYLLKNDKWKLVGNTYYQIPPKLFSVRWFKNLSRGAQVVTCVLLGGALTTAVAVPTTLAILNARNIHTVKDCYLICTPDSADHNVKAHTFSKNPYVLYVPILDYNNYIYASMMRVFDKSDDIIEFKNLLSPSPSKKARLNVKTGELTYESFSYFNAKGTLYPHEEIFLNGKVNKDAGSTYKAGHEYTINLKNYDLQPIEDNGVYYLPLDLMLKLDPTLGSSSYTCYYNGNDKASIFTYRVPVIPEKIYSYPSSFYKYCYDLFTFDVDFNYGLNGYSRPFRSNNNINFTYNKDGARVTFEKYKNKLISSKSIEEFDTTFAKMIGNELDDGGHTGVFNKSFISDWDKLPEDFGHSTETDYVSSKFKKEAEARAKAPEGEGVTKNIITFDGDSNGTNEIGYVYFPSFDANSILTLIDANNLFNKYINADSKITDVVIDIANNTGGVVAFEGTFLSWICGGVAKQVLKDARDDSVTSTSLKYDINSDESFDEKDYLPYDNEQKVNIYILTDASFSAACALTFDTYMYTKTDEYKQSGKKITFIGQPNLGGSCSVVGPICLPTGFAYRLSCSAVSVYWDDYSKTCDEILPIEDNWKLTTEEIMQRKEIINKKIVEARE